jgi:membrane fusion protein (multidrug efflux system)
MPQPQSQLDLAIAKQNEAKGSLTQLNAALDKAKLDLSYTEIRAPIDGRIGSSAYSVGNFIGPSSNVLATIVSQDPIYASFSVSQREILAIRDKLASKGTLGSTVDAAVVYVELPDGKRYPESGKVNFVDVTVDQGTDTVPVRATLPNPKRILIDGQLVTVIVEGGRRKNRWSCRRRRSRSISPDRLRLWSTARTRSRFAASSRGRRWVATCLFSKGFPSVTGS